MEKQKKKDRLDTLLLEKNLVESRNRARSEIMAGNVYVNGVKKDKPGFFVSTSSDIQLKKTSNPYVSRGGLKLEKAINAFNLVFKGKVVLDIGASTGGFTDCALKHGAELVYALDVGYGQLAWELRNHPRVVNLERFNARDLKPEHLDIKPDISLVDASFISVKLLLPVIAGFPVEQLLCLIKPQFEAKKEQVGKKGVIKKAPVHEEVLFNILDTAYQHNFFLQGLTYSPIQGPQGNIEYLLYLGYEIKGKETFLQQEYSGLNETVKKVVRQSHEFFQNN